MKRVAELGTGTEAGEREVAETTTSLGRDAEGEWCPTTGDRWQDGAIEIAELVQRGRAFLGGLAATVDERRELCGRGDIAAVEDPEAGSVSVTEETGIDDDPTIECGNR